MNSIICCRKAALAAVAVCSALVLSCQREYRIIDELSVLQHTLNMSYNPVSTHITVYANGPWTVTLDQQVEWASVNKLSGDGLGDFKLNLAANFGVARDINVIIRTKKKEEVIHVVQAGAIATPYLNLASSRIVLPSSGRSFDIAMTSNLDFCLDQFRARAIYYGGGAVPDTLEIGSTDAKAWISAYMVDEGKVRFTALENTSGADRVADIVYYMVDAAGVETRAAVNVTQSGEGPVFSLSAATVDYYSNGQAYDVPSLKNNIWSVPEVEVSVDGDWITDVKVVEQGLSFTTGENRTGAPRRGTIGISCPGLGAPVTLTVNQAAEKLLSFEDLRNRVPGRINTTDCLEGIIVSDPSSPNVCSSIQTGQFAFDRSVNAVTAYLESTDASYGLCLSFDTPGDNVFARGDHVRIRLGGTTLLRDSSPIRYTLSGLTADKVQVLQSGAEVPRKERTISQLTDADIYTWVSLQQVEILCKDGAYTNVSEGYTPQDENNPLGATEPRVDVAPLMLTDPSGNSIFMLTNCACPWRRSKDSSDDMQFFNLLPQGSGVLSGVIVADEVAPVRWGDLGRYQIRPMSESDIELGQETTRFSKIICEWTWNTDGERTMSADEGKGTLSVSGAGREFGQDYNNPFLPQEDIPSGGANTNLKGLVNQCALLLSNTWWNFETPEPEPKSIDVTFNTSGLSGTNLVFGIVWGHGRGANASTISAPSRWDVLYSTDGNSFTRLTTIKQRPCAWWTTTSQDATPGLTEHLVKLPGSCFNQNTVVVRLQPADFVTDIAPATSPSTWQSALGVERGRITANTAKTSQVVRIGTITVRYN